MGRADQSKSQACYIVKQDVRASEKMVIGIQDQ